MRVEGHEMWQGRRLTAVLCAVTLATNTLLEQQARKRSCALPTAGLHQLSLTAAASAPLPLSLSLAGCLLP